MSKIEIVGSGKLWTLMLYHPALVNCDSPEPESTEEICEVEGVGYLDALEAFAANFPEHGDELDALRDEYVEVMGLPVVEKKRAAAGPKRMKKRGSGERFRELIREGKTNEQCLAIVRAEFPDSKATLSDAAWNRYQLRAHPEKYGA